MRLTKLIIRIGAFIMDSIEDIVDTTKQRIRRKRQIKLKKRSEMEEKRFNKELMKYINDSDRLENRDFELEKTKDLNS